MKIPPITCTLVATLFAATPVLAQEGSAQEKAGLSRFINSEDATGSTLWDFKGNKIGTIEKVLLEPNGRGVFVVIDTSAMIDEERKVVVPWSSLRTHKKADEPDEIAYTLNADKDRLQGSPVFQDKIEVELFDPAQSRKVHQYWHIEMQKE